MSLSIPERKKSENEVAQSCPTLLDPMDCSLPGSSLHGIFQARVLEWVAISFSRGSSQPRDSTWIYPHCRQTLYRLSHQGRSLLITAAAKSLQLCPTLCDPIDSSPPGFPVPGILQARTLEWVAISFSNAWKWKVKVKLLSCVRLCATPPTRLLRPWDFPDKSTGVGCHCFMSLASVKYTEGWYRGMSEQGHWNTNNHEKLNSLSIECHFWSGHWIGGNYACPDKYKKPWQIIIFYKFSWFISFKIFTNIL